MFSTNIPFATGKPVIALFICAFLAGCHTVPPHSPDQTVEAYAQIPDLSDTSKVMRTERYTLVSIAACPAQQDLLQQIVDIRIPDHLDVGISGPHFKPINIGLRDLGEGHFSAVQFSWFDGGA
ncbi:hypothetical protein K5D34_04855 [Pseudomonas cichorii]|uniref:Uncharacterized protein n=1 Tax=Pseudomonas lijiangensis TaxID=2995658 RepID=A0ABX8HXR6_9PSED|nr:MULTISPECIES: hypothetical protein [Pseudomonas syringae group]MBX8499186.1 hypothetical protein [Pseudomonas lijiangensis]MBX8504765.1 hypothetical protein [Pseudomonas lijiangensis]MBX8509018.1 hypothetical protein [Pseudomonas cichorii]MBX8518324.1 hypothetical protein [Pseudomonas cichorii]MBX8524580.1 hypothetical protein [Pseudomonas cichorii]